MKIQFVQRRSIPWDEARDLELKGFMPGIVSEVVIDPETRTLLAWVFEGGSAARPHPDEPFWYRIPQGVYLPGMEIPVWKNNR